MATSPNQRARQRGGAASRATTEPQPAAGRPSGIEAASPLQEPKTRHRLREGHVLCVDEATSARMAGIRQTGTRPELSVRRSLTSLGLRYRLGNRDLPGSPDVANRRQRWVVFVHGCFWHRHGCKASTTPGRNREFWELKFARNVERDRRAIAALRAAGFRVVVIWECETKRGDELVTQRLAQALRS